jgi:hypothetical protein
MPTVSSVQLRPAVADDPSLEPGRLQSSALRRVELSQVAAEKQAGTPAWDPHEVWLNRVKKPRDTLEKGWMPSPLPAP